MKKGLLLVLILVFFTSAIPLFANTYYEKGNTFFSIKVGVGFPTSVSFPKDSAAKPAVDNIKLGGFGSLAYQACIDSNIAVGGEIGYCFNKIIDNSIFTQVPISAKVTYIPLQTGKFDLYVTANLGLEFIKDKGIGNTAAFASIALNPTFYFNDNWGVGLNAAYSIGYEFKDTQSALFGQLPLSLSVSYRK